MSECGYHTVRGVVAEGLSLDPSYVTFISGFFTHLGKSIKTAVRKSYTKAA